jgi:hypothetical protein
MGHLEEVNMSWSKHALHSLDITRRLVVCVFKSVVHAVHPDWFTTDVTTELGQILSDHEAFVTGKKTE